MKISADAETARQGRAEFQRLRAGKTEVAAAAVCTAAINQSGACGNAL